MNQFRYAAVVCCLALGICSVSAEGKRFGGGVNQIAMGKYAIIITSTCKGRIWSNGNIYLEKDRSDATAFMKVVLRTSEKSIVLPVVEVSGDFKREFDVREYGQGSYEVTFWAKKTDSSIPTLPNLEGLLATMTGEFSQDYCDPPIR